MPYEQSRGIRERWRRKVDACQTLGGADTRLPLYIVDMMQFRTGGDPVPNEEYLKAHAEFAKADTLVYVDQLSSRTAGGLPSA